MAGVLALCRCWQAEDNRNTLQKGEEKTARFPCAARWNKLLLYPCGNRSRGKIKSLAAKWHQSRVSSHSPPGFFFFFFSLYCLTWVRNTWEGTLCSSAKEGGARWRERLGDKWHRWKKEKEEEFAKESFQRSGASARGRSETSQRQKLLLLLFIYFFTPAI